MSFIFIIAFIICLCRGGSFEAFKDALLVIFGIMAFVWFVLFIIC